MSLSRFATTTAPPAANLSDVELPAALTLKASDSVDTTSTSPAAVTRAVGAR